MGGKTSHYCGLPHDVVLTIGKVTVAAARLELVAHDMLLDLGVVPGKRQLEAVLKEIRRAARAELPQHVRIDAGLIQRWTLEASRAVRKRHPLIHSAALGQIDGAGESIPVQVHIRTREARRPDIDEIAKTARDISRLATEGGRLHIGLLRSPRRGVFLRNVVHEGQPWVICTYDAEFEPERPTEAELDDWWRTLGPWGRVVAAP